MITWMKIAPLTVLCLLSLVGLSQQINLKIIPEPAHLEVSKGQFTIDKESTIVVHPDFEEAGEEAAMLREVIDRHTGIDLPVKQEEQPGKSNVYIFRDTSIASAEGYNLTIDKKGIALSASSRVGVFYGIQTLDQLFSVSPVEKPATALPLVSIQDSPRFEYRALMLDPARHFLPVEGIKKYIDMLSFYKFNYLHLHLTDDHGWRIEIKKYPLLTEVGSKRKETNGNGTPHGGYYTRQELKELVAYAQSRHVEIIPEIDMPGHGMSILAAYPDYACFPRTFEVSTVPGVSKELLCAGKEKVYQFYDDVIAEVAEIFPNPRLHLGGDEAPLDRWKECPHCQAAIGKHGLKNEEELMAHFFERVNQSLVRHKKEPLLWYESEVESYPENSTVILWRNEEPDVKMAEIKSRGLQMINSYGRNAYFDYPQWSGDLPNVGWMPVLSLQKVYEFDPVRGLPAAESHFIKGVEACVWGEYVPNIDRAFYMTYPRAFAFAEAAWSMEEKRSWAHFSSKLDKHLMRLLDKGVMFRPPVELSEQ